ncbi:MAG TPA: glycolate oxidase subunit GlcF [Candidatus Binatia bacterium]|nr:glycolate oxidase subunit GlcF [Candidatus Binatia bacterium]
MIEPLALNSVATPVEPVAQETTKVFDSHHPPAADLLNACVHCGFCLQTCPTYTLWGKEMDSPRGRIHLISMAVAGEVEMTDLYVSHFDHCLGCLACVTSCPSGMQYGKLIEAMRGQVERLHRRPLTDRIMRRMIAATFSRPARLRKLAFVLRAYQRLGVQRLFHALHLTALLPDTMRAMEQLMPDLSSRESRAVLPPRIAAEGEKRRTVALMTGCVQSVFTAQVNAATARVLAAEGCEVLVPPGQGCCGALLLDLGQEDEALAMARKMIDAFGTIEVDAIVVNAAGCGAVLKDYGYLLRDDPEYRERALAFSAKCKDPSEVLAELPPRAPRHPMRLRVGFHDPCHLQHAQGLREPPRAVLRTIPGVELIELPESALCCGSAGVYNLLQPETGHQLGQRKADNIISTPAQVVATGNPGCQLQISALLNEKGRPLPVMHYMELLDQSISGNGAANGDRSG